MPTIINGVGKKKIEEICRKYGLNWKEEDLLSKILQGWDKVVDKIDKIKIIDKYIGNKQKEECEKIVNALIQIDKEFREKISKRRKRDYQDDMASNVKG